MTMKRPVTQAIPQRAEMVVAAAQNSAAMPMVSVVLPAYNEAAILHASLSALCEYLARVENEYRWEIIVVDDGSTDETQALAQAFAQSNENVRVLSHPCNFGIGQAFITAFKHCRGDYVVTMDFDLSYSPDHIGVLLSKMRETHAKIVIASPYMRGGRMSNVPWMRRTLSIWANRFLSRTSRSNLSTLTGMVRAYDGRFLRSLNLKSLGMGVNPEIIFKAIMLRARIEEIPAHLDWRFETVGAIQRRSSMRVFRQVFSVLLSGFMFRPFVFYVLPGLALLAFAAYVDAWMVIHFWKHYGALTQYDWFLDRASFAVAAAYKEFPHTFIVGLLATTLGVQLVSMGVLALQNMKYFEELFHLGTGILQAARNNQGDQE